MGKNFGHKVRNAINFIFIIESFMIFGQKEKVQLRAENDVTKLPYSSNILPGCSLLSQCSPSWTLRSRCFPRCHSEVSGRRWLQRSQDRDWYPFSEQSDWNSARWCSTMLSLIPGRTRRGWTGDPIELYPRIPLTRWCRMQPCTSSLSSWSWWCPWI